MSVVTKKFDTMEYLTAEGITVPHGFTTRLGGVSQGYLASLNLGMHRGDLPENVQENYRRLAEAVGFDLQKLVLTWQIHSDIVRQVTAADANGIDHRNYPQCDALITNDPGTALFVFTADCTPILLQDPVTGAVGAIHAGWRGTAADIAGKTVAAMIDAYGCNPENIRAAIGPNIGPCCFETDRDVPDAMIQLLGEKAFPHIRQQGSKYYVNLKQINALLLHRQGVSQIDISTHCTACRPDLFWSHRVTGGNRGSQGAIIVCKEVTA